MNKDKQISLDEAAALVESGSSLALGGLTLYRRPMAFTLALAQRFQTSGSPNQITLIAFTAGLESDILVGLGMISRIRSCYFGLEAFGLAPNFTDAANRGDIDIMEETEASLAFGLRAALSGVGFMPSTAWVGTDLPRLRPDVKTIVDPYSGETLTAFPAIDCDLAVIHALEADIAGNALIGKNWGVDRELALVANKVIITAEKVVARLERADIVAPAVHAVVEAPQGAWPTSCHPDYPLDGNAILAYTEQAATDSFAGLLADWQKRQFSTQ